MVPRYIDQTVERLLWMRGTGGFDTLYPPIPLCFYFILFYFAFLRKREERTLFFLLGVSLFPSLFWSLMKSNNLTLPIRFKAT